MNKSAQYNDLALQVRGMSYEDAKAAISPGGYDVCALYILRKERRTSAGESNQWIDEDRKLLHCLMRARNRARTNPTLQAKLEVWINKTKNKQK